jgi:hypothetical protein
MEVTIYGTMADFMLGIRFEVDVTLSGHGVADLHTSSSITLDSASLTHYALHHLLSLPN